MSYMLISQDCKDHAWQMADAHCVHVIIVSLMILQQYPDIDLLSLQSAALDSTAAYESHAYSKVAQLTSSNDNRCAECTAVLYCLRYPQLVS